MQIINSVITNIKNKVIIYIRDYFNNIYIYIFILSLM